MVKGIDVSSYQGEIDFEKVRKSGVKVVIIRAGWGTKASQKDKNFEKNYHAARRAGLFVGAYWYSYAASVSDALKEARACLSVIKGKKFEFPIYFDLEEPSQFAKGRDFCSGLVQAFCSELESAGCLAGLYISRAPLQTYITSAIANRYALWIAEYGSKLKYRGNYGVWQYSGSGKAEGVSTAVDLDRCYVDYPSIIKNAGLNGYGAAEEEKKSVNEIALEVIRGDWGNGEARRKALEAAGYDYYEVQKEVERILGGG